METEVRFKLSTFSCVRFQIPSCWVIRAGSDFSTWTQGLFWNGKDGSRGPYCKLGPSEWNTEGQGACTHYTHTLHFLLYLSISSSHYLAIPHSLSLSLTPSCFRLANSPIKHCSSSTTRNLNLIKITVLLTITVNHRRVNLIGIWGYNKKNDFKVKFLSLNNRNPFLMMYFGGQSEVWRTTTTLRMGYLFFFVLFCFKLENHQESTQ